MYTWTLVGMYVVRTHTDHKKKKKTHVTQTLITEYTALLVQGYKHVLSISLPSPPPPAPPSLPPTSQAHRPASHWGGRVTRGRKPVNGGRKSGSLPLPLSTNTTHHHSLPPKLPPRPYLRWSFCRWNGRASASLKLSQETKLTKHKSRWSVLLYSLGES